MRFDVTVEIALGADITADPGTWAWTDITDYCMVSAGGVRIRRGKSDRQSTVQPSQCDVLLNNGDGRFSRLNPLGAYYGQLSKNTPIRVQACETGGTPVTRFIGFVSEWPPSWEPSERHHWVKVRADGVLRRLSRRSAAVKSPLSVYIREDTTPIAWWPLEDNAGTRVAFSGLTNGSRMSTTQGTAFAFGSVTDLPGAPQAPDIGGDGVMKGNVSGGAATGWCVEAAVKTVGSSAIPIEWDAGATGTYVNWVLIADATSLTFRALGMVTAVSATVSNGWHHVACVAAQDGADIDLALYVDGVLVDSDTDAAATLSAIERARVGYSPIGLVADNPAGMSVSHLAIYNSTTPTDAAEVAFGYIGEEAHDRFGRILTQESVFGTTAAAASAPMGPQTGATFLGVVRDCESADQGVLFDGLEDGLVFQAVSERYNLAVDLALDYDLGHIKQPFEPQDDDSWIRNDSTVTLTHGASARYEQTTGPLGTDQVGRYDEGLQLNLAADTQALDAASWRVHVGTVDEYRFPTVRLMFHSSASILADWLTCDIGSRITIDNMPANMPPDLVDQILEGYTERINAVEWHVDLNLSPYRPFLVGVYGDDGVLTDPDRYGVEGSELYEAVDSDDTSMRVVPGERRWTSDSADFDPDLRLTMGGETFTVSAIADAATFVAAGTASAVVNTSATPGAPAGKAVGDNLILFAGVSDTALSIDDISGWSRLGGGLGSHADIFTREADGTAADTPTVTVTGIGAGDTLIAQIAAFRGLVDTNAEAGLSGLSASQTNGSAQNIAFPGVTVSHDCCMVLLFADKSDDWTSVAAPTGFTEIGEPDDATGDDYGLWWGYDLQSDRESIQAGTITVTGGAAAVSRARLYAFKGLQTFTVSARSVNGVTKSHSAGAEIRLARDAVYAL